MRYENLRKIEADIGMDLTNVKYFLVIDLEATCTQTNEFPRDQMEIIEIGAVMVDSATFGIVSEFQSFVRPLRNPTLTEFCQSLTNITQSDVDQAPEFEEVLLKLISWRAAYPENLFCSWGDYDRGQFVRDCNYHGMEYPFGELHIDLKSRLAKIRNSRKLGLQAALHAYQLKFDGCHHRGIDDARNIAKLLPFIFAG